MTNTPRVAFELPAYGGWGSGYLAKRTPEAILVSGKAADAVGSFVLNRVASQHGLPVRVTTKGRWHKRGAVHKPGEGKSYA